jgi:hypothetical protein
LDFLPLSADSFVHSSRELAEPSCGEAFHGDFSDARALERGLYQTLAGHVEATRKLPPLGKKPVSGNGARVELDGARLLTRVEAGYRGLGPEGTRMRACGATLIGGGGPHE